MRIIKKTLLLLFSIYISVIVTFANNDSFHIIYDNSIKNEVDNIKKTISFKLILNFYKEIYNEHESRIKHILDNVLLCFINSNVRNNNFKSLSEKIIKILNISYRPDFLIPFLFTAVNSNEKAFVFDGNYNIDNLIIIVVDKNIIVDYNEILIHELFHIISIYKSKELLKPYYNFQNLNYFEESSILNEALAYFTQYYFLIKNEMLKEYNFKINLIDNKDIIIKILKEYLKEISKMLNLGINIKNPVENYNSFNDFVNSIIFKAYNHSIYNMKSIILLNYFLIYLLNKYGIDKYIQFYYEYSFIKKKGIFNKIYKKNSKELLKEFYINFHK